VSAIAFDELIDGFDFHALALVRTFKAGTARRPRCTLPCSVWRSLAERNLGSAGHDGQCILLLFIMSSIYGRGPLDGRPAQMDRLETLKRALYERAGAEILRARMPPLHHPIDHKT
jgi:hypothetical protein